VTLHRVAAPAGLVSIIAIILRNWPFGQFFFTTTNVTGKIGLPPGSEMVAPGDNAEVVDLDKAVPLDVGNHFAIREGGRSAGSGVITEVVE
jgi:elongation factor Tu